MKLRITHMLARVGRAEARAFTLLELLVAVGALAVIAVGVAAIFEATGRTVSAGKRVSAFSQYASQIEQRMRADIASMTRDGFLVIRNEYADGANDDAPVDPVSDAVPLYDGDPRPRTRRTDELMFFSKGSFRSARELMHPDFVPTSDSARIYYGHGKRAIRPADPIAPTDPYLLPDIDDTFENQGNGRLGMDFPNNPNRFASDWVLLRHVTLLRQPQISDLSTVNLPAGVSASDAQDSDIQIALQPAASNIFRSLNTIFPTTSVAAVRVAYPAFASGLVDIATTDLAEIRSIIMSADKDPGSVNGDFFTLAQNSNANGSNEGVDGLWIRAASPNDPILQRMRAWMHDALPAYSMAWFNNQANRTRIHAETAPVNLVGVLSDASLGNPDRAFRAADQAMLSSSAFLPRCTEFIVEWSFGETFTFADDPTREGETIWHGMERTISAGGGGPVTVCQPYDGSSAVPWSNSVDVRYRRVNGSLTTRQIPRGPDLIHDDVYNATQPHIPLSSFFGYVDPTFDPDADGDGRLVSPLDAASPTLDWPWPKLIRVTMSLADPRDPTIEQTFQFVFDVPAGHEGR